jgi:hypothetical protein
VWWEWAPSPASGSSQNPLRLAPRIHYLASQLEFLSPRNFPFYWYCLGFSVFTYIAWKISFELGLLVRACNPSLWGVGARESRVWGQPGLYTETLLINQLIN